MDEQLKSNLTSSKHWIRLLFMLLFAMALYVASVVMGVLVIVQFLFALITGNSNFQLRRFGDALSIYIFDTLQFLIYNSDSKPFPFADWPESNAKEMKESQEQSAQSSSENAEEAVEESNSSAAPKRKANPRKKTATKKTTKETTKADVSDAENLHSDDAAEVDTTENKNHE